MLVLDRDTVRTSELLENFSKLEICLHRKRTDNNGLRCMGFISAGHHFFRANGKSDTWSKTREIRIEIEDMRDFKSCFKNDFIIKIYIYIFITIRSSI